MLKELHWLPIAQRVDCKLCLLVHKSIIGNAPVYLTNLLTAVADVPCRSALRDASNGDFVITKTRLKLGERAAPHALNRLPSVLKTTRSTTAFKRGLKTFPFRTAYYN
jgi:hypothetical protein